MATIPPTIRKDKNRENNNRIFQGDIFENIFVYEDCIVESESIILHKIVFPYVICLNQECDLQSDYKNETRNKDGVLLHLILAPVFLFEKFKKGQHWGNILESSVSVSEKKVDKYTKNELPRYHYLKFIENDLPEFIIDFKYFFTINRNTLYKNMSKRVATIPDLFKERISQRFTNYLSRIGLPEIKE